MEFRGSAKNNLPKLLNEVEGLYITTVYCEEKEATQQPITTAYLVHLI